MTALQTAPITGLVPVALEDLPPSAALQTRKDRKYLLPAGHLSALLDAVSPVGVLEIDGTRTFRYQSVYFDTPEMASYMAAARRRPNRVKVRTRAYLDTGTAMLEVKTRDGRGRTVKDRVPHPIEARFAVTDEGRRFVASLPSTRPAADRLETSLITTYQRTTLIDLAGAWRVTVDTDLRWALPDRSGPPLELPGMALVETKTDGHPCAVDHVLWNMGIRPTKISKYGTGLAALRPELPANKWHRVLTHHFR